MATGVHSAGFSDALVILGAAGVVIPAFARFRVNPVIGFILVGVLAGPYGLGSLVDKAPWLYHVTISNPAAIEPFAEFGIVLLLFSIGLELSFRRLWAMRGEVFGLGAAELLLSGLIIGTALHFALPGLSWAGAFGLGVALTLSSTALVLPMAGMTSPVGRTSFAMLLFEDLALVPVIFILGAIAPRAGDSGVDGLIHTLWTGALTIAAMLLIGRFLLPRLFAQAARTKSPELFLAISLLVVILSSIATAATGLSPIVGALIAGLLIAETEYHSEVELVTSPFKGLALGVFLITVGMGLDLRAVMANWPTLLVAVAGVIVVKTAVMAGLLRLVGTRMGVAAEIGFLMASPSETTLIVLGTALQAGLIDAATAAFWQTVTAIGLILTPVLALVGRRAARTVETEEGVPIESADDWFGEKRSVIVGMGRVGTLIAEMLREHRQPYLAVDADIDTVERAKREGYNVMFGDISRPGMIERLDLGRASSVILTMDDPVHIVHITRRIRRMFPQLPVVVRARDANHAAELYRAGATDAVPETLESSLQLSEAVLVDLGLAMGPVIESIHRKRAEMRDRIVQMSQMQRDPITRKRTEEPSPASRAPGGDGPSPGTEPTPATGS